MLSLENTLKRFKIFKENVENNSKLELISEFSRSNWKRCLDYGMFEERNELF